MPVIIQKQFFEPERYSNGERTGRSYSYNERNQYMNSSSSSASPSSYYQSQNQQSNSNIQQPQQKPKKTRLSKQEKDQREACGLGSDGLYDARYIVCPTDFQPILLAAQHSHPMDQTVRLSTLGNNDHVYFTRWGFPFDMRERTTGQISVSQLKEPYFLEFNRAAFFAKATRDANGKHISEKYKGMTDEEICQLWDRNRDLAAETGTKVHRIIECYLNGMDIKPYRKFRVITHFLQKYKTEILDQGWIPFRTEWSMRSSIEYLITGQADALFVHKNQSPKDEILKLRMIDWKFTDNLTTEGYRGETGIGICSHLPKCKKTEYGIQQFAYKKILEDGYKNIEYMGHKYPKLHIQQMDLWVMHDLYEEVYIENIDQDNDSYSSVVDLIFSERRKFVQQKKATNDPDFAFLRSEH